MKSSSNMTRRRLILIVCFAGCFTLMGVTHLLSGWLALFRYYYVVFKTPELDYGLTALWSVVWLGCFVFYWKRLWKNLTDEKVSANAIHGDDKTSRNDIHSRVNLAGIWHHLTSPLRIVLLHALCFFLAAAFVQFINSDLVFSLSFSLLGHATKRECSKLIAIMVPMIIVLLIADGLVSAWLIKAKKHRILKKYVIGAGVLLLLSPWWFPLFRF